MSFWLRIAAWVLLAIVGALTVHCNQPPASVGANAAASEFSAARAQRWVERIASEPRPTGSNRARQVAEQLRSELLSLGLVVIDQRAAACTRLGVLRRCGHVHNVLGVLSGTKPGGPAVLLSAHYDTVPSSPGAGDNAAGVAALLETARALSAGHRPESDVIFAFVDGEEEMLLGATALVRHAAFQRAFLVANFEARGNRGPSVLIDTTSQNAALVQQVGTASRHVAFNSLYVTLAGVLPNGTDAEVYEQHAPHVLSYALADGLPYYHQRTDTPERLDPQSLQHHGTHALDLVRHFANASPDSLRSTTNAVFFDLFGRLPVSYPTWLARAAASLLFLVVAVHWLRHLPTIASELSRLGKPAGALLASALGCCLLALGAVWAATQGWPHWASYESRAGLIAAAVLVAAGAVGCLLTHPARRKSWPSLELNALRDAGLGLWLGLTLASAWLGPGTSHLFFWPLLGALACRGMRQSESRALQAIAPLGLLPAVYLLTLLVRASGITFGAYAAGLVAPIAVLGLTLTPPGQGPSGPSAQRVSQGALALGLALLVLLQFQARLTPAPPVGTSMIYAAAPERRAAYWASPDRELENWHRLLLGERPTRGRWPELIHELGLWRAPAEPLALPTPVLSVLADESSGKLRRVRLHAASSRQARVLLLQEQSGARIDGLNFPGASLENIARVSPEVDAEFLRRVADIHHQGRFTVSIAALPAAGATLELTTTSKRPLTFRAMDITEGHPRALKVPVRPSGLTLGHPGDQTWVVGSAVTTP